MTDTREYAHTSEMNLGNNNLTEAQYPWARTNGFMWPFSIAQISTYIVFLFNIAIALFIDYPSILAVNATLSFLITIVLIILYGFIGYYTYKATNADPTDPTVAL